jgi:hypothetical protein
MISPDSGQSPGASRSPSEPRAAAEGLKGKQEMAIGRTDERQNPVIPVATIRRPVVWMSLADPIWVSGQRPASKAGHMTAFELTPASCDLLEPFGPFSNRASFVNGFLL